MRSAENIAGICRISDAAFTTICKFRHHYGLLIFQVLDEYILPCVLLSRPEGDVTSGHIFLFIVACLNGNFHTTVKIIAYGEMTMDIFQVFRDRRSIRKYKDTPVEREKIEQILDAARLAPSWKNLQCWRFLVLTDAVQAGSGSGGIS